MGFPSCTFVPSVVKDFGSAYGFTKSVVTSKIEDSASRQEQLCQ
jgi:hypothetical protein